MPTLKGQIKFDALRDLFSLYNQFDYNRSFEVSIEALKTANETGDSLLIIRSYRMNGYALMNLAKNPQAIEVFQKALDLAASDKSNSKIKDQIKFILNSIALAYTDMGNYPKALDFHFKSLVLREEESNKFDISIALNNIGLVYYRMSDYQKAIEFYDKCLSLKNEIEDKADNERLLINMALCYLSLNENQKAISRINDALIFCGENCTDEIKREALNSIGIAYLQINEIEKARESFAKSLVISKAQNNIPFIALNLIYLNKVDQRDNNSLMAKNYLKQAEDVIEGTGYTKVQLELYIAFTEYYKLKRDYEKSLNYSDKYISLYKEVLNEKMLKNLSLAETNYAERENIKTIKEKDEILLLKQQLIDRQRAQYFYIVLVAILTLGFAVVLLFDSRRQRKSRAEIGLAKEKIEEQNKLLEEQNKALDHRVKNRTMELSKSNLLLSEVNAELDNFLYKTSHDIRGPIATMQGLCNLGLIDSKDPVVTNVLNQMVSQSDRMSKIVGRLTTISDINHTILRPEKIDFLALLDWVLANEEEKARSKNIQISFEVAEGLQIISDELMIRTILENLVNNGIKFYNHSVRLDSFVKVQVSQNDSIVNIRVIDNGIGIGADEAKADGMFHIFTRASERSETGGVGLYLSKLCSHKIGGQIRIEKSDDDGTIFLIQLPVDLAAVLEKRRLLQEDMQRILEEENTQKAKLVSFT